jgi:hypothetical protein
VKPIVGAVCNLPDAAPAFAAERRTRGKTIFRVTED